MRPVDEDMRTSELLAIGLSAARTGDMKALAAAEKALAEESDGEGYDHVMHMQVGALHHAAMGHGDKAIEMMGRRGCDRRSDGAAARLGEPGQAGA